MHDAPEKYGRLAIEQHLGPDQPLLSNQGLAIRKRASLAINQYPIKGFKWALANDRRWSMFA